METSKERFFTLLREAAFQEGDQWKAVVIPIHAGLSGFLSGEEFDAELASFKEQGHVATCYESPGEPHDDDDVLYLTLSPSGARTIGLD